MIGDLAGFRILAVAFVIVNHPQRLIGDRHPVGSVPKGGFVGLDRFLRAAGNHQCCAEAESFLGIESGESLQGLDPLVGS